MKMNQHQIDQMNAHTYKIYAQYISENAVTDYLKQAHPEFI